MIRQLAGGGAGGLDLLRQLVQQARVVLPDMEEHLRDTAVLVTALLSTRTWPSNLAEKIIISVKAPRMHNTCAPSAGQPSRTPHPALSP